MKRLVLAVVISGIIFLKINSLQAKIMMWEIGKGNNVVYLLGSIHVMPEDAYPLDEQIEAAFEKSDLLVVELDPGKIDQNELNDLIVNSAFYPDGTSLKSEIPTELYNPVIEKFQELGMPEAQVNQFRPWFVALNLGMGALQKLEINSATGIDIHFLNKAHEKQLTILEMETPTAQMEVLSSMQDSTQIDYLQYVVEDYDNVKEDFMKLLSAWEAGDADKVNKLYRIKLKELASELPGMKEYYQKLLPDRDKQMADQIKGFLESEEGHTYFVIAGVIHLVGKDGILQLLKDEGYSADQF
ncbi:MAG: hypothetical protein APR54_03220 [Candidatus Cloacimonas sp. SDB]|nr:MAG: hypothetical protein APR54_03220 [Candidatus Cloacimonas sp. SDB]